MLRTPKSWLRNYPLSRRCYTIHQKPYTGDINHHKGTPIEKDKDLKKITNLQVDGIMDLTEFTATATYFSLRGQLFKQTFGTAMGSPVSPIMAKFFMEWFYTTGNFHCSHRL